LTTVVVVFVREGEEGEKGKKDKRKKVMT